MHATVWQRIRAARSGRRTGRLWIASAALAATLSVTFATPAPASPGQSTIFDLGGFALNVSPQERTDLLNQTQALGTDTVRALVFWRNIAPSPTSSSKPQFDAADPAAYPADNWTPLDDLVRGAQARGMNVLLTPTAPMPDWASGGGGDSRFANPSADEFQKFVTALGIRYSGSYLPPAGPLDPTPTTLPRVDDWSVWNEPNIELFLIPQFKGRKSVSGRIYRGLFLAAQNGLQNSGHGGDALLIGETSPGPGRKGTDPISFLRGVFCLNRKFKRKGGCAPIRATGWAQHPYNPFDPPFKTSHGLIDLHTIGKLAKALRKARRATSGTLPIYVTEYGVESVPDRIGVSQLRQAEFIGIAEYLMYRNRRIRSFGQYLMDDDPGGPEFSFQTGLRFAGGAPKISYSAFPITLALQRKSRRDRTVTVWGHARPADGSVPVTVKSRQPGKGPRTLRQIRTNQAGYFRFNTPFRRGRKYQATAEIPATAGSPARTLQGPFERVYIFK